MKKSKITTRAQRVAKPERVTYYRLDVIASGEFVSLKAAQAAKKRQRIVKVTEEVFR